MISHAEAEALISARLDGPLDPVAERELIAHLTKCPHCRQFAEQSNHLAQGLRDIPFLPASPAVSRAVLAHINRPRSPLAWIRNAGSNFQLMPTFSALATVLIVVVMGVFIFNRIDRTGTPLETGNQPAQVTGTNIVEIEAERTDPTATSPSVAFVAPENQLTPTAQDALPPTNENGDANPAQSNNAAPTATGTDQQTGQGVGDTASSTEPAQSQESAPTKEPSTEPLPTQGEQSQGFSPTSEPTSDPSTTSESSLQIAGQDDLPTETVAAEGASTEQEPTSTIEIVQGATLDATTAPTATENDKGRPGTAGLQSLTRPDPTATDEPTATTPPEPTATDEPTATTPPEPTATNEPTATTPPEPTATDEPTATTPPEPTATNEPTATTPPEPTATDEPTATTPPEPTATDEPTATTPPEPTATDEPTATVEPTATNEPTATEEPTATDEPTATGEPAILPIDGTFASVDDVTLEDTTPAETPSSEFVDSTGPASNDNENATNGDNPGDSSGGVIEPAGPPSDTSGDDSTTDTTVEGSENPETPQNDGSSDQSAETQIIEPSDGSDGGNTDTGLGAASDTTPDASGGDTQDSGDGNIEPTEGGDNQRSIGGRGSAGSTLDSVAQPTNYGSFSGDLQGMSLAIDSSNNLVLTQVPAFTWLQRPDGYTIDSGYSNSGDQGIQVCDPNNQCLVYSYVYDDERGMDRDSAGISDIPVAWLGDTIMFMHITSDEVRYRSVAIDLASFTTSDEQELLSGDPSMEETVNGAFYGMNGVLIPARNQWLYLALDGSSQILGQNPFTDISLVRVHESLGVITYVGDGQLVMADLNDPGNVRAAISFSGGDYDLAPGGDMFVVSTGSGVQIIDFSGGILADYPAEGQIAPGGVLWVQDGVLFVDVNTGDVLLIPLSALP